MSRFSWNFAIENDIQLKDVLEWEKISWYFWAIFSTPCLITPAESTLGSLPLKIDSPCSMLGSRRNHNNPCRIFSWNTGLSFLTMIDSFLFIFTVFLRWAGSWMLSTLKLFSWKILTNSGLPRFFFSIIRHLQQSPYIYKLLHLGKLKN